MAIDPGQAPREDTPQGMNLYAVTRMIRVLVKGSNEDEAIGRAAISTALWADWDWLEGSEPKVEEVEP